MRSASCTERRFTVMHTRSLSMHERGLIITLVTGCAFGKGRALSYGPNTISVSVGAERAAEGKLLGRGKRVGRKLP